MTQYFDFPKRGQEKNNIHLVIYVPSTINVDKKVTLKQFKKRILETMRFLRKNLGGSTTVKAIGNYNSENYGSVTEEICKIEAFTKAKDYDKVDKKIRAFLNKKKKLWKQESISYEYEEQLYFV